MAFLKDKENGKPYSEFYNLKKKCILPPNLDDGSKNSTSYLVVQQ
jgi:hypothetical protein